MWNIYHSFHDINKTNDSIIEAFAPQQDAKPLSLTNNKKDEEHSTTYWDSSKSVVMGMINGYHLSIYETFVGSLRATGYPGHIILGVANDAPKGTIDYLNSQNVTIKYIENAERCTYNGTKLNNGKIVNMQKEWGWKCTKDHPDYKLSWGRFVHYKDWLDECTKCTDGVILTDVRDAYFQRDPFDTANKRNQTHSLMVFEEDPALGKTEVICTMVTTRPLIWAFYVLIVKPVMNVCRRHNSLGRGLS